MDGLELKRVDRRFDVVVIVDRCCRRCENGRLGSLGIKNGRRRLLLLFVIVC